MANGKNTSSSANSNKGGGSKAALRAVQEAASNAAKKAERARIKAAKEAKQADLAAALAAAQQANAAREQARIAAANKSPEDLLKGVVGEYYLPSTFQDEEDGVPHERTEMVWIRVFESKSEDVPMFQLLEDQMGIPVYLLTRRNAGTYMPLDSLHYKVKNEMRNCFFYVYNAVKGAVAEQQAKRAASDAAKAARKDAVRPDHASHNAHAPLTSTERAKIMARNAKTGRDAALAIYSRKVGQYLLGDHVFMLSESSGVKSLSYIGALPDSKDIGVSPGDYIKLSYLLMPELSETVNDKLPEKVRAIHSFVHKFGHQNGVRAKPAVAQATSRGNGTGFLRSNMRSAQSNQSAAMH